MFKLRLTSLGTRRQLKGLLHFLTQTYAAGIAAWTFYAAVFGSIDAYLLSAVFLCAMLSLAFLNIGASKSASPTRPSPIDILLSSVSIICGLHILLNSERIVLRIANLDPLSPMDMFVGIALLVLTLEGTRRAVGLGLVIVVLIFGAYNLFGHLLGGIWAHGKVTFTEFIDLSVFTSDGIFGLPTRVAATYAFMFVLFGTLISYSKGGDFFFFIAARLTGKRAGGPAKIAVVSSGLFGMISGSPASDVVTTGSITIPMMRRVGYSEDFAGAVEVAASTGGSILPPVMGAAAFIMVEFTGIPYQEIALAALVPALLYYLGVYSQVHFRSLKLKLVGLQDTVGVGWVETLRLAPVFLVPLSVLVVTLMMGYSPTTVAAYAAVTVLAVAVFQKLTRIGPIALYQALAETVFRMLPVTAAIAAAGLVIVGVNMTGLASKFASVVFLITNENMFFSLLIAALLTIVLGLGMPTPSAYILAAIMMGPLLVELNIPPLAAHLFLLYYAVLSAMTPPVATAAFVASTIAQANPMTLAWSACRLSVGAFTLPFVFVYSQGVILQGDTLKVLLDIATAAIGILALSIAIEGYFRRPITPLWRLLVAVGGVLLLAPGLYSDLFGLLCLVVTAILHELVLSRPGAIVPRRRGS